MLNSTREKVAGIVYEIVDEEAQRLRKVQDDLRNEVQGINERLCFVMDYLKVKPGMAKREDGTP